MARNKRQSINYGDLSDDILPKLPQSNKASPILVPNSNQFQDFRPHSAGSNNTNGTNSTPPPQQTKKNYNDDALARLSGTSPSSQTVIGTGIAGINSASPLPPYVPGNKTKRQSHLGTIYKPHDSIAIGHDLPSSADSPLNIKPTLLAKRNRFSSFDGTDRHKARLVSQMLSPIDTSGSESFSPTRMSPSSGLGFYAPNIPNISNNDNVVRKTSDVNLNSATVGFNDDDHDILSGKSFNSPILGRDMNPFATNAESPVLKSPTTGRHYRSQSVNFHSRNKSLSVKPGFSPNLNKGINAPNNSDLNDNYKLKNANHANGLNRSASANKNNNVQNTNGNNSNNIVDNENNKIQAILNYDDFRDSYCQCVPIHTSSRKSLFTLMTSFTNSNDLIDDNQLNFKASNRNFSLFGVRNLLMIILIVNNFGLLIDYSQNYLNPTSFHSMIIYLKYNSDIQFFTFALLLTPLYYIYGYVAEKTIYLLTKNKFKTLVKQKFASQNKKNEHRKQQDSETLNLNLPDNSSFNESTAKNNINSLLPSSFLLASFLVLYSTQILLIFSINNLIIIKFIYNPLLGTILEVHTIVHIAKILSFALTNKNLRELYFKSINLNRYNQYMKLKKKFINEDGTVNLMKKKQLTAEEEEEKRLLSVKMTGTELAETINNLKFRKNSEEMRRKAMMEDSATEQKFESEPEPQDPNNFKIIDYNLQPAFYEGNYYPKNITMQGVFYFSIVPTLVYQPVYPRSQKISWKYCLDKVMEIVILTSMVLYLSSNYAIPTLKNSIMNNFNLSTTSGSMASEGKSHDKVTFAAIEIIIKLANISILIWFITYYVVFHAYCNLLAELTKFDDRHFYSQWWNSGSVSSYWRNWNSIFTQFLQRHLYQPLMIQYEKTHQTEVRSRSVTSNSSGKSYKIYDINHNDSVSNNKINFLIFFIMAILQEVMVGIPTGNIMGISFICIIMQSPLSLLTNQLDLLRGENSAVGNVIFWISFMIGQPLCILLYYFTWNIKYGELSSY